MGCAWWRPVPLGDRIFLLDLLPYSQHFAALPPTNPDAAPILGKTPFEKVRIAVWTRLLRMLIWLPSSRGPLKNWLKVELDFPFYSRFTSVTMTPALFSFPERACSLEFSSFMFLCISALQKRMVLLSLACSDCWDGRIVFWEFLHPNHK